MTRIEKHKELRECIEENDLSLVDYSIHESLMNIENRISLLSSKIDELSYLIERQSESLYQIARYDNRRDNALDELMEHPLEQIERLFK